MTTRPDIPLFSYHGRTSVFFAYADGTDLHFANENFQVSEFEHTRQMTTLESQLYGGIRAFLQGGNLITSKGFFSDVSTPDEKIVALSGFFGIVNYISVGKDSDVATWSGLDTTMSNFLWACLVEEDRITGFRSSRKFGDWDPVATTAPALPPNVEGILVATYTSGELNTSPIGSFVMPTVLDHVNTNIDPHGPNLVQTALSGLDLVSTGSYRTSPGVPQTHTAPIIASSGVAFDGVDFSELVQMLDGSVISKRTHLHSVSSGLQWIGAAPSEPTAMVEQVYGTAGGETVAYTHNQGFNCVEVTGARTKLVHLTGKVPENFKSWDLLKIEAGLTGGPGANCIDVHLRDTTGARLLLADTIKSGWPSTLEIPVPVGGVWEENAPFEVAVALSGIYGANVLYAGPWTLRYHAKNS